MMRKRKTAITAHGGADFGPALRPRSDGRLTSWGSAATVEVEDRDDPDFTERKRLVRGARRRDALLDLQARRIISKRMRDAAEQFLDDCSVASGSSAGDDLGLRGLLSCRGLPERQVAAITRVRLVRQLLSGHSGGVFWWVIFENGSLTAYESAHKMRSGSATTMLKCALQTLDEHYHGASVRECA